MVFALGLDPTWEQEFEFDITDPETTKCSASFWMGEESTRKQVRKELLHETASTYEALACAHTAGIRVGRFRGCTVDNVWGVLGLGHTWARKLGYAGARKLICWRGPEVM